MSRRIPPAPLRVAVVGVTGAAGGTVLRVLEERGFPVGELRALASRRSVQRTVRFAGLRLPVAEATEATVRGVEVAFLAAGGATSRRLAPVVVESGGIVVDKSSAFRMDPGVPLVVPEVNGETVDGEHRLLANPNCVAVPLSIALAPLQRVYGLRQVTVATYQAASGAGMRLVDELRGQQRADAAGSEPQHHVYPHVLHGNVVPGGWAMEGADTEEEAKVVQETRKILGLPELGVSVTTVRVPVEVGHSLAVWAELGGDVDAASVTELLAGSPGIRVVDDPAAQAYPTPREVAGGDLVHVGRIRADSGHRRRVAMFVVADNLRKGAATNAVQIAELALARRPATLTAR